MRILLPVEDSPFSRETVRSLITQYQSHGVEVRVLHVVEPFTAYLTPDGVPEIVIDSAKIEADRKRQSEALVAEFAQQLQAAGFTAEGSVEEGDPKHIILDIAESWPADLIVMGSHGFKGLSRFLLGSVSDAVARHAACSVQVVRFQKKLE